MFILDGGMNESGKGKEGTKPVPAVMAEGGASPLLVDFTSF
jgi:hypothetical protein